MPCSSQGSPKRSASNQWEGGGGGSRVEEAVLVEEVMTQLHSAATVYLSEEFRNDIDAIRSSPKPLHLINPTVLSTRKVSFLEII